MTVASKSIILTIMCKQKKQTLLAKMSKIGVHQSILCFNLYHCKTYKYVTKKHKKAYRQRTVSKKDRQDYKVFYNSTITQ